MFNVQGSDSCVIEQLHNPGQWSYPGNGEVWRAPIMIFSDNFEWRELVDVLRQYKRTMLSGLSKNDVVAMLDPPRMHFSWKIWHARGDIFEKSEHNRKKMRNMRSSFKLHLCFCAIKSTLTKPTLYIQRASRLYF